MVFRAHSPHRPYSGRSVALWRWWLWRSRAQGPIEQFDGREPEECQSGHVDATSCRTAGLPLPLAVSWAETCPQEAVIAMMLTDVPVLAVDHNGVLGTLPRVNRARRGVVASCKGSTA